MNLAVICELNPFHNGHKAIFQRARELAGEDAFVVAVMSGNFCQRGEPAIIDKWRRTEIAIKCGVDGVLEIPCVYSSQSAQFFAEAASSIITKCGFFDGLVFGSETGDLDLLINGAQKLEENADLIKDGLREGLSYPRALEKAQDSSFSSNDLLGIEYIRAFKKRNSDIKFFPIKRVGNVSHGDEEISEDSSVTSAKSIRNEIVGGNLEITRKYMPNEAYGILYSCVNEGKFIEGIESLEQIIISRVREMGLDGMKEIPFTKGGLSEKLLKECQVGGSILEIIENSTSKYYTKSRIKRSLLSVITGAKSEMFISQIDVPYIRVLGVCNKKKTGILKALSTCGTPVICGNIPADFEDRYSSNIKTLLIKEIKADDIYVLGYKSKKEMVSGLDLSNCLISI